MTASEIEKHNSVVGIIHITFGALTIICAVLLYIAISIMKVEGIFPTDFIPSFFEPFIYIIPMFVILYGIIKVIGGIGVIKHKNWGRYMIIVVSVLGCIDIPIGTLISVYSIWVLLQDETIKICSGSVDENEVAI